MTSTQNVIHGEVRVSHPLPKLLSFCLAQSLLFQLHLALFLVLSLSFPVPDTTHQQMAKGKTSFLHKTSLGCSVYIGKKTWKKANMLSGKLQTAFPSLQQSFQILERTRHRTTRSQEFWGAPDPMLRPVFLLVMLAHIAPLPKVFVFHA